MTNLQKLYGKNNYTNLREHSLKTKLKNRFVYLTKNSFTNTLALLAIIFISRLSSPIQYIVVIQFALKYRLFKQSCPAFQKLDLKNKYRLSNC